MALNVHAKFECKIISIRDGQYGCHPIAIAQGSKRDSISLVKFLDLEGYSFATFTGSVLKFFEAYDASDGRKTELCDSIWGHLLKTFSTIAVPKVDML